MRLLHYLEIQNFKRFGDRQRIELAHPAVLIGPNNCGKTTAMQAIALWSQAVKTWHGTKGQAPPRKRMSTSLNRLAIVSVPVQRTRYFWHNTHVRRGNRDIPLLVTVGVSHEGGVEPVTMRFRNQGDDLVYCTPDERTLQHPDLIAAAARIKVRLLYPMSGLETEEPILRPGRIDVLLGQGQTAQVLRNLCLLVFRDAPEAWNGIVQLMQRLFEVRLDNPQETARGSIQLHYRQEDVKERLDVALAGRGFQQLLLVFAYLHSFPGSVLLIDEPDAHLEILRQRQVYLLLREIATRNASQVVLVTHSEVILEEALDHNLTLLLEGQADDLAAKASIRNALKHYGAAHYVRARQRGYVLYVEGRTDLDILRALARRLTHRAAECWDEAANVFFVQDNYPRADLDAELERVEGGFGATPQHHFFAMRGMVPDVFGLAILDSDGRPRQELDEGGLRITWWDRYEAANYFVTPLMLTEFVRRACAGEPPLFERFENEEVDEVLDALILERVFPGRVQDFTTWQGLDADGARLVWEASTAAVKLSDFAEEFFRRLADRLGRPLLLRKGELHRLVELVEPASIAAEVTAKLDLLADLFSAAKRGEEA